MKNLLFLIFLCLITEGQAQFASGQFEFNNFAWHQNTDGLMFYNAADFFPGMEAPANSDLHTMFTSSLWIGGRDPATNLYFNGQTYCNGGCAFKPGPLTVDGTAQSDEVTAAAFDRFWSVSQAEIDQHLAYYACVNDPGCDVSTTFPGGYEIPESFMSWPAEGDVEAGYAANLASFYDYNEDGEYNPEDGDHPAILGDFSTFCILNGSDPASETTSNPTGFEIHVTVYGYEAEEGALFNSLYMQYKIINRGTLTLSDTYVGVFNDFDLGNPMDDRLGTDVARSTVFVYNGSENDPSSASGPGYGDDLPVFGMRILGGPLSDPDGMDNPSLSEQNDSYGNQTTGWGDGIVDNERLGLARSLSINNSGSGAPAPTTDPAIMVEFYNYLRSMWKDGTPLTFGGYGYNPSDPSAVGAWYVYPGLSDPLFVGTESIDPEFADPLGWTDETSGLPAGDRRSLSASGPFTFNPGDVQYLDLVYLFVRDSDYPDEDPLNSFSGFVDQSTAAGWGDQLPDIVTGVRDVRAETLGFNLFPNPTRNMVTLESQRYNVGHYSVFDLLGKVVMQGNTTGSRTEISVGHLPKGLYLIRYEVDAEAAVKKLVVE